MTFGVVTRRAALSGALMMLLFFVAQFPPEHNPFMGYYLVYAVLLGILGAVGAGGSSASTPGSSVSRSCGASRAPPSSLLTAARRSREQQAGESWPATR
jgi:hypothetical protein